MNQNLPPDDNNNAPIAPPEPLPSVEETVELLRSPDEAVRHNAVQTVRELCLPKTGHCVENRKEVGDHGGIELLVEMLDARNGDVQRSTCLALNEACLKNPVNSRTFQSCGAIPRVMRVLESGNPDLQTQALAVLGTSAVNAVEVRRGLKDAGAVPLLVSLLGSKTAGVQEWAAYALRKASSKASDLELAKAMIEEAIRAGADRKLVEMCNLRSRDAQEEAKQTLEYFDVDQEAVQELMAREEQTKPLVALQRLCWMAVYHPRLGQGSSARALPLELVEIIAQQSAPAAREDVQERWDQQGLAWVDSLNWQQRALQAEARVGAITLRLAELQTTVEEITKRDASLHAVEERVDQMDKTLVQAEGVVARAVGSRSALQAMQLDVMDLVERLGDRLNVTGAAGSAARAESGVGGFVGAGAGGSRGWGALPPPIAGGSLGSDGDSIGVPTVMPTKTQHSASKSTTTPERPPLSLRTGRGGVPLGMASGHGGHEQHDGLATFSAGDGDGMAMGAAAGGAGAGAGAGPGHLAAVGVPSDLGAAPPGLEAIGGVGWRLPQPSKADAQSPIPSLPLGQ